MSPHTFSSRTLSIPLNALRLALGLATISATGQVYFSGVGLASFTSGIPLDRMLGEYPVPLADGSNPGNTMGAASSSGNAGSALVSFTTGSGWFGLSASAQCETGTPAEPATVFATMVSRAYLRVSDLEFSGPGVQVPVSLNLLFSSAQHASVAGATGESIFGSASVTVTLNAVSGIVGSVSAYADSHTEAYGLLEGYSGGLRALKTDDFDVPTDTAVSLDIGLSADAYDHHYAASVSQGNARAAATLSLPTGVPIFNLPAGYTANSASLHVVNNRYSPPTVAGETKVTPAISGNQLKLTWTPAPGKTYTAQRAATPTGPYETVAIGLTHGTYIETIGDATGRYYRVIAE